MNNASTYVASVVRLSHTKVDGLSVLEPHEVDLVTVSSIYWDLEVGVHGLNSGDLWRDDGSLEAWWNGLRSALPEPEIYMN